MELILLVLILIAFVVVSYKAIDALQSIGVMLADIVIELRGNIRWLREQELSAAAQRLDEIKRMQMRSVKSDHT